MMHGTWDSNAHNAFTDNALNIIERYIEKGYGVLSGHDTIGANLGTKYGMSKLGDKFNITRGVWWGSQANGYDINYQWFIGSDKVRITKKGFLTQFPWNLGSVGTVLNVPYTHTASNGAKGNVWMEFENPGVDIEKDGNKIALNQLPSGSNYSYYLTTWNNTAMIQTGHSNGNSTEDERKVLANTLFYLKQLTHKKEILDNSARDLENPNKPGNISTAVNEDNTTNIRFRRPEDNGSTYEYYVKGLDGAREFTSDTKSATITTGVKKYKYAVTEGDTDPEPDSWKEATTIGETESINIGEVNYTGTPKYIHIKSVDGAGNESEVYRQKLEKPNAQEIEITKEVVNGKKDYKVGEEITYSLKFKIKENETNKGKISNITLGDTYNNKYLELVKGSILKDNTTTVGTDEIGGNIKISTDELVYGKTKEIRYKMRVLDTANGKADVTNNVIASGKSFTGNPADGNVSKKIIVNDPKLEIQKSVDKLEYKVGDEVTYKVKVKSLVPGTTLNNINIEEIIPKGLDLKEDSAKISINGRTLDSGLVKTKDGDITKVTAGLTTINRK